MAPDENTKTHAFSPGSFGCHEAMHMASFFADSVDRELCEHPAIMLNPHWSGLAAQAAKAPADLYQAIGKDHC